MFAEVHDTHLVSRLVMPEASLLLATWELARGLRAMPTEAELSPEQLRYQMDDIMLLRPEGDDFRYEHYGHRIAQRTGVDMTGRLVSEFDSEVVSFFLSNYRRVRDSGMPLVTLHRRGAYGESPLWERVLLPVGDGTRVSRILTANRERAVENELSRLAVSARNRAIFLVRFTHDASGRPVDGRVVGANPLAREITRRSLEELLDRPVLAVFPGLVASGLWARYIEVAETRQPQDIVTPYDADGVSGVFRVRLSPFHDAVAIEFEQIALLDSSAA